MIADGVAFQPVFIGDVVTALNIAIFRHCPIIFKVVVPTGEFEAVEAPFADFFCKCFQR